MQSQQSQITGSQTDPFLISRRLISCWLREWLSVRASMSSRHPPGPRASNMCWCAGLPFREKYMDKRLRESMPRSLSELIKTLFFFFHQSSPIHKTVRVVNVPQPSLQSLWMLSACSCFCTAPVSELSLCSSLGWVHPLQKKATEK